MVRVGGILRATVLAALLPACPSSQPSAPPDADVEQPDARPGPRDSATGDRGPPAACVFDQRYPPPVVPVPDSCPEGYYQWLDQSCGPRPPGAEPVCGEKFGDGRCYKLCTSDGDCTDPAQPHCSVLGLFRGSDTNCWGRDVRICRCKRMNDCY